MHAIDYERWRYEDRLKAQRDARFFSRLPELERKAERAEGHTEGEWVGTIHLCQRRLGRALTPADELYALPLAELQRQAEQLEREVFGPPPKDSGQ
jgi:hypothetical protein